MDSSHSLSLLLDRELIAPRAAWTPPGRPILYGTTPTFLRSFGLASLEELPPAARERRGRRGGRPVIPWILLAVLAALVLLACFLRLGWRRGDQSGGWVKLRLGPKWISLIPGKKTRIRKPKSGKRKAKGREKAQKKRGKPPKEKPKPTLGGALDLALDLLPAVREAAGKFRRALQIDHLTLELTWGEPDLADAAIHYGRAWGVVEALLAFVEANFVLKDRQVALYLDYQLEKPRLYVRAALSLTVAQLLGDRPPLGVAALKTLWNHRKETKPRRPRPPPNRKGSQAMEKNHPVNELMAETIRRIREAVDANTVVGEPIVAGEITLVPVSKISFGFGTGGSEFGGKAPKAMGENPFEGAAAPG